MYCHSPVFENFFRCSLLYLKLLVQRLLLFIAFSTLVGSISVVCFIYQVCNVCGLLLTFDFAPVSRGGCFLSVLYLPGSRGCCRPTPEKHFIVIKFSNDEDVEVQLACQARLCVALSPTVFVILSALLRVV